LVIISQAEWLIVAGMVKTGQSMNYRVGEDIKKRYRYHKAKIGDVLKVRKEAVDRY
jgi:hypothetical protein